MTHPNKSLHLKSRTILNSNRYEPAEPNPTTPNPPNERPRNEHPPHEHPPNENSPNENSPYEHHPPAKTRQSASRARAKQPPAKPNCPNHTPTSAGLFPPRRPTRRGHRVPYTRFGGYILLCDIRPDECTDQAQGKTRDHAATHTPDPRLPATYMRTKQIQRHTPAEAGVSPLPDIRLDKCTDQVQSKTRDRAAPIPPTLDFPQQQNMKQIQHHTPAEAGYHTIDTARDVPPL
ncbi:hypothetical protein BS47DRAFT_1364015 [Hydnum rufescens UP504]|uniref:Uncharacterized protein n=1 Tax=Hydnum rufescens UP504 TaxID=1448309 RepID=A0A9P6AT03_9AGAM|nr:hypothetical protein BS47DRAFT_1364015 [Hydnum rufescens UP504]